MHGQMYPCCQKNTDYIKNVNCPFNVTCQFWVHRWGGGGRGRLKSNIWKHWMSWHILTPGILRADAWNLLSLLQPVVKGSGGGNSFIARPNDSDTRLSLKMWKGIREKGTCIGERLKGRHAVSGVSLNVGLKVHLHERIYLQLSSVAFAECILGWWIL